jgi:uncharacterized Zn finger protein
MPESTCSKCGNQSFELIDLRSTDTKTTIQAVQCESCGTIVGVVEDLSANLTEIERRLKSLEVKLRPQS